jgi:hypothetical protein
MLGVPGVEKSSIWLFSRMPMNGGLRGVRIHSKQICAAAALEQMLAQWPASN